MPAYTPHPRPTKWFASLCCAVMCVFFLSIYLIVVVILFFILISVSLSYAPMFFNSVFYHYRLLSHLLAVITEFLKFVSWNHFWNKIIYVLSRNFFVNLWFLLRKISIRFKFKLEIGGTSKCANDKCTITMRNASADREGVCDRGQCCVPRAQINLHTAAIFPQVALGTE